jgi:transposase, IS5 family
VPGRRAEPSRLSTCFALHSIGVIKRVFGYAKVRYRGLAKNRQRLWLSCGLANLFIVRRRLLRN